MDTLMQEIKDLECIAEINSADVKMENDEGESSEITLTIKSKFY
jgi:hypothetical protein